MAVSETSLWSPAEVAQYMDSTDSFRIAGGTPRHWRVSRKVIWLKGSACDLALSKCSETMTVIVIANITFAMLLVSRGQEGTMQVQKSSLGCC